MTLNFDETTADINTVIELLSIAEQFNLLPGTEIKSLDHLAELIEEHMRLTGKSVNDAEIPAWHNKLESLALQILGDPENAFSRHLIESRTIPNRLARMRFSNLFAGQTGLRIKFSRIPHIVYFPLVFVFGGIYAAGINLTSVGYTIVVISILTSFLTWLQFTSRERTIGEFADVVVRDNLDQPEELSRGDIMRYVTARFPNGLDRVTIPEPDDGG